MLRLLLAYALLLSILATIPVRAESAAAINDDPAVQDNDPTPLPQTRAQWRARVQALTPGMTPEQVANAIGRVPDRTRKSSPGHLRLTYEYYVNGNKRPGELILYFTDGVYTRAQW